MAIWRDSSLESLFGGPLDASGITHAAIDRLVTMGTLESEVLDFKRDLWLTSQPKPKSPEERDKAQREFAKDIAAMANRRGGVLVVGIQEQSGRASSTRPLELELTPEQEETRLMQALHKHQAPLASCEFIWIEGPKSETLLAIVVPPSTRSPHAVSAPKDKLGFPLRTGSGTIWMNEHDIAEQYRKRFLGQADQDARIKRAVDGFARAMRADTNLWLFVVLVPESAATQKLSSTRLAEIGEWYQANKPESPLGRTLTLSPKPLAGPGMARFTIHDGSFEGGDTEPRGSYLELHTDGTAVAATCLNMFDDENPRGIGHRTLVDDLILLNEATLRWAASQAGESGIAEIVVGITDGASPSLALDSPVELYHTPLYGGYQRVSDTRAVQGEMHANLVADLSASSTIRDRLPIAGMAIAAMLQFFGLPESPMLGLDGIMNPSRFGQQYRRQVEAWLTHVVDE